MEPTRPVIKVIGRGGSVEADNGKFYTHYTVNLCGTTHCTAWPTNLVGVTNYSLICGAKYKIAMATFCTCTCQFQDVDEVLKCCEEDVRALKDALERAHQEGFYFVWKFWT